MKYNRPFSHSAPVSKLQKKKVETRVNNFIQITVFCPPNLELVPLFYRKAGTIYCLRVTIHFI